MESKLWYALIGPYHTTWDDGTYDLREAYSRLMSDPDLSFIAVIDEDLNYCLNELYRGDLDPLSL